MAGHRPKLAQRDSFSDLTGLMKAKKPYTPISPPTSRSKFGFATKGEFFEHALVGIRLGAQSISGEMAIGSLLSPWAAPCPAIESVADFIEREEIESTVRAPRPIDYSESRMHHLEALFEQMKKHDINGADIEVHARTPSPQYQAPQLTRELDSPIHFGPRDLPNPADSYRTTPSPFLSESEPVIRLAKHVYDSLGRDLDNLEKEKQELLETTQKLTGQLEDFRDDHHEVGTQLGLLKYQNEANRTQKADMGRALNEKEVKIKTQQLEIDELRMKLRGVDAELKLIDGIAGERDYLRDTLSSVHDEHTRALEDKDQELEQIRNALRELKGTLSQVTSERDAATRAHLNAGDHATRAETLLESLNKREKIIIDLRQKYLEEQLRVTHLEDEIDTLKARHNEDDIDDLKQKLREKTSTCDRQRAQLKIAEQHLKISEERTMKVSNNGEALRGAAHLVAPHAKGKLPRNVVSCSECYANNLTCDTLARCRSCSDRNTQCARWRCSLKQKLGNCPLAPCKLPHDAQGWLVLQQEARPQW